MLHHLADVSTEKYNSEEEKLPRIKRDIPMIKGLRHREYRVILNVNAPNKRSSTYTKQKMVELKVEIEKLATKVGDFNILLLVIYGMIRQKSVRTDNP